jgi:chromosome partitioning protein
VRILTVANLKGGVGKTTLAANLAAYFDTRVRKRVLAIDLDFQGSLSSLFSSLRGEADEFAPNVARVLCGDYRRGHEPDLAVPVHTIRLPNTDLIASGYRLAPTEDGLLVQHLIDGEKSRSLLRLYDFLLSDTVQDSYSLVILDAPPRLSAATLNALRVSHAYLIPTRPTRLSAEAVPNFERQLVELIRPVNPAIRMLGVVPTMTDNQHDLSNPVGGGGEKPVMEGLIAAFKRDPNLAQLYPDGPQIFDRHIPDRSGAQGIGRGVALLDGDAVTVRIMSEFGREVARRWGIEVRDTR